MVRPARGATVDTHKRETHRRPTADPARRPPGASASSCRAGDGANYGFQFRGARIVDAVLESLVKVHGMGSNGPGEKLIFGGCSAVRLGGDFYCPSASACGCVRL